jgi:hypothetical protein
MEKIEVWFVGYGPGTSDVALLNDQVGAVWQDIVADKRSSKRAKIAYQPSVSWSAQLGVE